MLEKHQKKVIAEVRKERLQKDAATNLEMTPKAVSMVLTRVYQDFEELLTLMIDDYEIFERRFKFSENEPGRKARRLARLIKVTENDKKR